MQALDILEEVSIFADLSMDELALIVPLAVMKEGKAGDFLIQEGECVESVYILLAGTATVMKTRTDGKKVAIDEVGKDDLLGEVTFFKNTPASASVQATAPFRALQFNQKEFHRLLDDNPPLGLKIYKKFSRVLSVRIKKRLAQLIEYLPA
ncbi:MAG: cyclic nucleotide-binding domain-containing protein [Nitrospirae bacterium]|nr:MAG: cyclic nucleotide-binding domain-containing protein [Nitrospirota bacterium]